ncbi:MAG: LysM peptidoglycan-binding domain-containing protein [Planctomycetes bacterium]|nr:LysM peptidoglycan-binding domain-containing protein [Planctomycetota bacterium]
MGRLEKQIISGAVALVAILLVVVLVKGIEPANGQTKQERKPEWQDAPLVLANLKAKTDGSSADDRRADVVDLGSEESSNLKNGSTPAEHGYAGAQDENLKVESSAAELIKQAANNATHREDDKGKEQKAAAVVPLNWDEELRTYKVKPNESLSEIAQKELGSINYLSSILELNEGLNANRIREGQDIWLPSAAAAKRDFQMRRDAKLAGSKAEFETDAKASSQTSTGRTHKVVGGDSLWRIAKKYYPQVDRNEAIKRIVKANAELKSENSVLELDMVLQIPR